MRSARPRRQFYCRQEGVEFVGGSKPLRNKLFPNRRIDDTERSHDSDMRSPDTTNSDARRETMWGTEMTGMILRTYPNAGIPRCDLSPTAKRGVTDATKGPSPIVRPVTLDRGNVLRIRNGRGTRIRAASGMLWITEENSPEDHVLLPGDVLALAQTGMALVLAHRAARVVVEVPVGVTPPRAVEMAPADGEAGRRIALATPAPISLPAIGPVLVTALGDVRASIRTLVRKLTLRCNAVVVSTSETRAPMLYSDGFPPKHLRRRMMSGAREVERMVIDE